MSKKKATRLICAACGALLALAGVCYAFSLPGMGKYEKVKAVNGVVTIQTAALSDGNARFYRLSDGGREIRFFLVRAADGSLKSAFDACDVCYREKKGYEQQGSNMICRNCNKKFAVDRIGPHAIGGCNPSYLPARPAGATMVITLDDLRSGARFF